MVNREIEQVISRFIKTLSAKGVHIEKVILYGSFASGKSHEGSDIDIAVISPDFGKDRFEKGKSLHQIAWRVDPRIEPVPIPQRLTTRIPGFLSFMNSTQKGSRFRWAKIPPNFS